MAVTSCGSGWSALALPAAIFMWTTFVPPHIELFRDQMTGGYGSVEQVPENVGADTYA